MTTEADIQSALLSLKVLFAIKYGSFFSLYSILGLILGYVFFFYQGASGMILSSSGSSHHIATSLKTGFILASMTAFPSYSDLMAWVLLNNVGVNFDPSNPFMILHFFVIPASLVLVHFGLQQMFYSWRDKKLFYLGGGKAPVVTETLSAIFTLGPLMITSHAYGFI